MLTPIKLGLVELSCFALGQFYANLEIAHTCAMCIRKAIIGGVELGAVVVVGLHFAPLHSLFQLGFKFSECIQKIQMIKEGVHLEAHDKGNRHVRIVLLGWLGSEMKYVNKYSDAWAGLDCSTLNVIDTRSFFRQFWVPGRAAEVAQIIMRELIKDKSDDRPLLIHVFSNGGASVYTKLVEQIYNYNAVFNYKPLHVAGVIFDSCPGINLSKCKN